MQEGGIYKQSLGLRCIVCICSDYFFVRAEMKDFGCQASCTLVVEGDTVDPDEG